MIVPYWTDFNGLITHFKDRIGAYYLCNVNDSSTTVAISACGQHTDKIAVTSNTISLMDALNIPEEYDVRNLGEHWMFQYYGNTFSTKIITYQDHSKSTFLGDYTVFTNAFQFFEDIDNQLTTDAFARMDDNSVLFGWGQDELQTVEKASMNGISVVASDWAENITVFSNMDVPNLQQHTHADENDSILYMDNVHTVCFLMTDGDNLNWYLHEFADPNHQEWYGSSDRGYVDMGWTISPGFSELAPTIMKYVYDHASNTNNAQDYFVASSSGFGYMYPNLYPSLDTYASLLNEYMAKADLNILNILGTQYSDDAMLPFLQQPNIDAIFYYDAVSDYSLLQGEIRWVNNKPVIGARYNFWEGFNTVQELADKLNNASRDANSPDGYSLIPVHAWSRTVADVNAVVDLLDDDVIVVTPDEFVKRIINKLGTATANEIKSDNAVSIYPNPSTDGVFNILINNPQKNTIVEVYDVVGKLILNKDVSNKKKITVDISGEKNGIYYLKVVMKDKVITKKIILQKP